jgi:hypothetical protein
MAAGITREDPDAERPAAPSSSAVPRGMNLIGLRPSMFSNSSPGSRASWAVVAVPTIRLPLNYTLMAQLS